MSDSPAPAPSPFRGATSRVLAFAGRWLMPKSLFGRVALIIVLGIAGSQLVSVVVSLREYQRGGSEIFASVMVDRVVSYTSLFESLRPQDRESTASALSRMVELAAAEGSSADCAAGTVAASMAANSHLAEIRRTRGRRKPFPL